MWDKTLRNIVIISDLSKDVGKKKKYRNFTA
ncbi:MAG: hypothetical protein ACI9V1_003181 [Spirosomataceae bacterium]|jgi:hypothetical protein